MNKQIKQYSNNANPPGGSGILIQPALNGTYYWISVDQLKTVLGAGLTAAQIKTLYESNVNTNAFTDAYKAYLDNPDSEFKGYYQTAVALGNAYPTGQSGWWAAVYDGVSSYKVWIWDTVNLVWANT